MATKLNLTVDQGSTFSKALSAVKDSSGSVIDLSTYTVSSQIRKHYTSTNAVSFSASGNSSGIIVLSLSSNATANLSSGRYVYDVEIVSNTSVTTRVYEGIVTITPQVTR